MALGEAFCAERNRNGYAAFEMSFVQRPPFVMESFDENGVTAKLETGHDLAHESIVGKKAAVPQEGVVGLLPLSAVRTNLSGNKSRWYLFQITAAFGTEIWPFKSV